MTLTLTGPISDAHIDRDALAGHRFDDGRGFPPSYVRFVEQYGWGRTIGLWLLYPPVLSGFADGFAGRGAALTRRVRAAFDEGRGEDYGWMVEPDGSWDLAERAVLFAWSENGDALLWDTRARAADGEFDVYVSYGWNTLHRAGATVDEAFTTTLLERLPGQAPVVDPLSAHRL